MADVSTSETRNADRFLGPRRRGFRSPAEDRRESRGFDGIEAVLFGRDGQLGGPFASKTALTPSFIAITDVIITVPALKVERSPSKLNNQNIITKLENGTLLLHKRSLRG